MIVEPDSMDTGPAYRLQRSLRDLPSVGEEEFKTTMRTLAASVCVVTSCRDDALNGMTATACCSVSATPPSVLVVVNQTNRSHGMIHAGGRFALNILSAGQQALATHFATRAEAPFDKIAATRGIIGCPLIAGCTAALECVLLETFDVTTHTIFVGRVVATHYADLSPLLYCDGRFGTMS
ncbi:flavin reductase family protein [Methylobacterium sp. A49B]